MIIGINAKIGAGKDTVGKIIQHLTSEWADEEFQDTDMLDVRSNWKIKKFAGKLKEVASLLTGIPVEKFEDQEFKKTFLPREWDTIALKPGKRQDGLFGKRESEIKQTTVRELLQKLGTEAMRDGLHENVWVNALMADYCSTYNPNEFNNPEDAKLYGKVQYPNWIITDMRFPNEMNAITNKGGTTIRVTKPGTATGTHPSEIALDDAEFDYEIINDGTIEDLIKKVKKVLLKEKLI